MNGPMTSDLTVVPVVTDKSRCSNHTLKVKTHIPALAKQPISPTSSLPTIASQNKICSRLHQPKYVIASVLVSLGGVIFGFDTGIIGPITTMTQFTTTMGSLSSALHGAVVSSILIPAAVASFFGGHLADKVGRPRSIAIGALIFGIGNVIEAAAMNVQTLIAGRVIEGIGEGLYLSMLVVYICEIAPPRNRGRLASAPQLLINLGIVLGYFASYASVRLNSSAAWRGPFAVQGCLSFCYAALVLTVLPQSPRWLQAHGHYEEAQRTWLVLGVAPPDGEHEMQGESAAISRVNSGQTLDTLAKPRHDMQSQHGVLKALRPGVLHRTLTGVFLLGFQQLSGIDGVLYYAPMLYQRAGLSSSESSFLASGLSAVVMLIATTPGLLLADRWSRKASTVVGGLAMATCMLIIGALYAADSVGKERGIEKWIVIVFFYIFAIAFSMTWAVGIKIWVSEMQPAETRAAASSLAYSANWTLNWLVAFTTPVFLSQSSSGLYFLFGSCTLLTVAVCLLCKIPETIGRRLENVQADFPAD